IVEDGGGGDPEAGRDVSRERAGRPQRERLVPLGGRDFTLGAARGGAPARGGARGRLQHRRRATVLQRAQGGDRGVELRALGLEVGNGGRDVHHRGSAASNRVTASHSQYWWGAPQRGQR